MLIMTPRGGNPGYLGKAANNEVYGSLFILEVLDLADNLL
jgi:hypothetical protein